MKLKIKSNKEYLLDNYIKFEPSKISNDDNNLYIFCHIITKFDKNEYIMMDSSIATVNKLKSNYVNKYYVEKNSWERFNNQHTQHLTLIDIELYKKNTKNDSEEN
jgi:hypothetical protein